MVDLEKNTTENQLRILENQKKALFLRRQGASYRAIGEQLSVSHIQARKYVKAALEDYTDEIKDDAAALVETELDRLDSYLVALKTKILAGNEGAIDRALKIHDARVRLLGLSRLAGETPEKPLQVRVIEVHKTYE